MQPAAPTRSVFDIALSLGSLLVVVVIVGWGMWRWLKKSEDPARLIFKWVLTVPGLIGIVADGLYVRRAVEGGWNPGAAILGVVCAAVIGLYLAIIWRHEITNLVANPFGALYDGGNAEVVPQAYYSMAEAKRKRGNYAEAVAEIRKQLEKFPTDYTGQLLLAEIQAENLNDLPAAELTIQRFCQQPGHAPRNIAFALNSLADWHLKYALDRDAARADLEQVSTLLPDSEFALLAEQRIGHLASPEHLLSAHDRPRVQLSPGVHNIGLLQSSGHLIPTGTDPAQVAQELVSQLSEHPQDTEAREKLAVLYADHYQRLDLATEQLQQLIEQPNQPARQVVRWLNLLADLQIRHGSGHELVAQTLNQIIERYPDLAAASLARNRLNLLKLEFKANAAKAPVKLGEYEQNIGLKHGQPNQPG